MKTLDVDSPSYEALELEQIRLSSNLAETSRKITVEQLKSQETIKNEALIGAIKRNVGDTYDMFLSSEMFKQLLIGQSFGAVQINPGTPGDEGAPPSIIVGQGESQRSLTFDALDPSIMNPILMDISNRAEAEGIDVFGAYYSAATSAIVTGKQ